MPINVLSSGKLISVILSQKANSSTNIKIPANQINKLVDVISEKSIQCKLSLYDFELITEEYPTNVLVDSYHIQIISDDRFSQEFIRRYEYQEIDEVIINSINQIIK